MQKASDLLRAAYEADIEVKINLLLTAGESFESIEETTTWLDQHNSFIKGVSVGPVIMYGWPSCTKRYIDSLLEYGTTISHSPVHGIIHLNLSNEIDYERSMKISNEIGRRYMTAEDYFFLKSFSYYSRDYKYNDFVSDILEFDHDYGFDISCIINQLESVP